MHGTRNGYDGILLRGPMTWWLPYGFGDGGNETLRLLDKFRLSPCRLHPSLRRSLALQRLPYLPHPLRKNSNYVSEVDRIAEGRPGEVRQSLTPCVGG